MAQEAPNIICAGESVNWEPSERFVNAYEPFDLDTS